MRMLFLMVVLLVALLLWAARRRMLVRATALALARIRRLGSLAAQFWRVVARKAVALRRRAETQTALARALARILATSIAAARGAIFGAVAHHSLFNKHLVGNNLFHAALFAIAHFLLFGQSN